MANLPTSGKKAACIALGLIVLFGGLRTAQAEDEDPFQMNTQRWMSFEHYKDVTKRGTVPIITPAATPEENPAADSTDKPLGQALATPIVAAPKRPLDLPVMPGLNKGFSVRIDSTADDFAAAPVTDAAAAPTTLTLPEQNWHNPPKKRAGDNVDSDDKEKMAIAVRMSFLPNNKITPIPSPDRESVQARARLALLNQPVKPRELQSSNTASCAAVDAFKKQHLQAIQGDRQTLKALQDAITALGLQKQLGFMTGKDSTLNGPDEPATPKINPPATSRSTTTR